MDTAADPVLSALKRLREGRGLTEGRLAGSGAVLSALGTSDPSEGLIRLRAHVDALGDGERQRALRLDFGLELTQALGRPPVPRELDWLGDRRAAYGQLIGRDVKTLARWSDATIADLRARLISDSFAGNLYVVAAVKESRIIGITVIEEDLEQPGPTTQRRSHEVPNPSPHPSIPALVYGFPRDWRPAKLHLAVVFQGEERPMVAYAMMANSLMELSFASDRHELRVADDGTASCLFERPSRHLIYAITW